MHVKPTVTRNTLTVQGCVTTETTEDAGKTEFFAERKDYNKYKSQGKYNEANRTKFYVILGGAMVEAVSSSSSQRNHSGTNPRMYHTHD